MTGIEIILVVLALVGVLVAATVVRALAPFIVNSIAGLLVLFLGNAMLGLSVAITPIVVVIVALGGILGALVVVGLALLGVAFVP